MAVACGRVAGDIPRWRSPLEDGVLQAAIASVRWNRGRRDYFGRRVRNSTSLGSHTFVISGADHAFGLHEVRSRRQRRPTAFLYRTAEWPVLDQHGPRSWRGHP